MSDVMLSVEVVAKMKALSAGLKQGTTDINNFVNNSMPGLKGLQSMLNSLGVNTSTQGIKNVTSALQAQRLETEKNRTATTDAAIATQNQKTATEQNRTAIEAQKAATERAKLITEANRTAVERAKEITQQQTAALIQQRIATEAQRTAMAGARAAQAALNIQTGQGRTSMRALSGSYDETRQRMTALGREIRAAGGTMSGLNPIVQSQIAEYNRLNDSLKRVDATMGNHQRNVGNYSGAISGAASALTNMVSGYVSAAALLGMAFSTALKTDAITTSLEFTFGSVDAAKVKMDMLRLTANRLGLEYISLAEAYRSFAGAAVASNFSLKETDKIFNAVANAGAKMKLTTDQVKGALTALQQMISKGTVQSEELRGQLGERLPGAFAIAARAMGVTQQELGKLLQGGKVLAEDLLPKLAVELDKTFSNDKEEVIESLGGSVNRLQNHFTALVETKGAVSGFFTFVIDRAADTVGALAKMSEALGIFYELASNPRKFIGDSATASRNSAYDILKASTGQQAATAVKNEGSQSNVSAKISKEISLLKELDANYKKLNDTYQKTDAGDRSLTDTKKLQDAKTALQSQLLLVRALKLESDKMFAAIAKPAVPVLDSIVKIRKEIALLSATSGSSTKGSDVYNRLIALRAQLSDLLGKPAKTKTKVFDSLEKQVQDFQNKANLITKVGLAKDLQEWEDKYNKIKAVIAKMPSGIKKDNATAKLDGDYKSGKADIVSANTAEVIKALDKSQKAIDLAQLDGVTREIQASKDKYKDILLLAEGNAAATLAIKRQEGDELTALTEGQAAKDINTSIKQLAEIAKAYRSNQAEIFEAITLAKNPFAGEAVAVQQATDDLKELLDNKLITFEAYQSKFIELTKRGDTAKAMDEYMQQVNSVATSGVSSLASSLGEGIGGLVSGTASIADVAGSLMGVVGDIATQLGQAAIKIGIGMIAIKKAFTNPFTAIAAGIALVAVGAAIKNTSSIVSGGGSGNNSGSSAPGYGVPHFAMGVENFGGGVALVGERGPELVNLPTGSDVIPNHKVMQSIAGGSANPTFVITNTIKMGELVTAIKRQERVSSRL